MRGLALTATELALSADVSPPTARGHFAKLVEGKMLNVVRQGRRRYFRLAAHKVAELLELLMETTIKAAPRRRPRSVRDAALVEARMCYNRLACRIALTVADSLTC